MKKFTVIVEKDPETEMYVAQCIEIPQAISQGETEEEALKNVKEAIELVLEYLRDELKVKDKKLVEVSIE
ncbi:MAG: type II toxin-antitoxin system HicB family antitoxin [Thermoproteota archaeon]